MEASIDNFKRLSASFPRRPKCGEIDLLAINTDIKIIFVLEAKNLTRKLRPYDVRQEINTFFKGKKSLLAKLDEKKKFVEDNVTGILNYFSIKDDKGWKVLESFVVQYNYPSAYYTHKKINFVLLGDLPNFLRNAISPCMD